MGERMIRRTVRRDVDNTIRYFNSTDVFRRTVTDICDCSLLILHTFEEHNALVLKVLHTTTSPEIICKPGIGFYGTCYCDLKPFHTIDEHNGIQETTVRKKATTDELLQKNRLDRVIVKPEFQNAWDKMQEKL